MDYPLKNVNLSFVVLPCTKSKPQIANLFAIFLSVLLLGFSALQVQAQNLTVKITKTDSTSSTVTGAASLQGAIGITPLGEVAKLEISAGDFVTTDWNWLRANRTALKALTHFTITDSINSVADIPDTEYGNPYFSRKINELSMAKIARVGMHTFMGCNALTTISFPNLTSIGGFAFRGCTALSTANFPLVTSIGGRAFIYCTALSSVNFPLAMSIGFEAFSGCTSLSATKFPQVTSIDSYAFLDCVTLNNLMLGATPPVVYETNAFENCPDNRFLIPINASGTPLTGQDLTNALASYKNIDDGNTNDSLWYGWIIEPPHPIVINPSSYGTVSSIYPCAPAGITVALIVTPDAGYILQSLRYTKHSGGGAITIDTSSCTFTMPNDGVTVSATFAPNLLVTVNDSIYKSGTSLENALSGIALNQITSLTITGGPFYLNNWYWLQNNRNNLNALTHFTITDGVVSIADVPTVEGWEHRSIFGKQIIKLCVAKVTGIGGYAFQGCSALNTAYFPQVTSIGGNAFENCIALANAGFPLATSISGGAFFGCTTLINLMLGATPPENVGTNPFNGCPDTRYLIPVNADGTPLSGQDLTNALASYKNVDDGNTGDSLWYGWKLGETLFPVEINYIGSGTVTGSYRYAPAGATVKLSIIPEAGNMLQSISCVKFGGDEVDIDMSSYTFSMPAERVTVNAIFAPNVLHLTVNDSIIKSGTSLENALDGVELGDITSLTIMGGAFFATDWNWLKDNRTALASLTYFTITDGVTSVADIPNTQWGTPYFSNHLKELSVAKIANIGNYAFSGRPLTTANFPQVTGIGDGAFRDCALLSTTNFPKVTSIGWGGFYDCTALTTISFPQVTSIGEYAFTHCNTIKTASFPQVTSIGNNAFFSCRLLANLMLGATPPVSVGADVFAYCPTNRFLIPVDESGIPLTGTNLTDALASYKNIDDGNTNDSLWYGWIIEPTHPIAINPTNNGTVDAPQYASAGATVTLIVTPDAGYILQNLICTKQGGEEVDIDMNSYAFTMPNEGVTISATFVPNLLVTVNGSNNKSGTSLENALSEVTLGEITSLTITGGPFFESDWNWLKNKRTELNNLTHFTITSDPVSVADIPDTYSNIPYFGEQIIELNVAKIANIGNFAFSGCTALSTASFPQVTSISWNAFENCTALTVTNFPQVTDIGTSAFFGCTAFSAANFSQITSIGNSAFANCTALTNLMLGATPPVNVGTNAFSGCPDTRFLIPVNTDGTPLTGQELTNALSSYKNIDDGDTNDNLWYGWKLGETLYPITINPASNGTVNSSYRYAPADATVTLTPIPDAGYILQSLICVKQGGGEVTIDMNNHSFTMPNDSVTVSATFVPNLLVTVNGSNNKSGNSLENALDGIALDQIISLTITGGPFMANDWNWLKDNRDTLTALTHFTITNDAISVADIPNEWDPYFGEQIIEVSVTKVVSIGNYAFYGCTALTTISFPQVTSIGLNVFQNCTALSTASFPQATTIRAGAFYNCTSLGTANFPQVTSIGNVAFAFCTTLITANFPQVTNIGEYAFKGCTILSTACFPQVTNIEGEAFHGCIALSNLMLGAIPPSVANTNVFSGCPDTRFLIPVNADGTPLTGQELTNALASYKNTDDGDTNDNLWYGWKLGEALYHITINPANNGTVSSSYSYAPADATVTLTPTPDVGYILQSLTCTKQGGGEVPIDMNSHTFTMPNDGVIINATFVPNLLVTVNGSNNKSGTSLENALDGVALDQIISLTITGGPFFASDWNWLKNNRDTLTALIHFTITDDASSLADIPDTYSNSPYFGEQIIEVNVDKVASIGDYAFSGCTTLSIARFPQVTGIGNNAFQGCVTFSNLMLGATPPSVADTNVFSDCPDTRFLIPVNSDGTPLTGQELTNALASYKNINDGDTNDNLWYGWKLGETLYTITINPTNNGTVSSSYRYAPANTTVTITISPNIGYRLKEGSLRAYKTGEESTTVTITNCEFTMPAYGITIECEFELIPIIEQFTITFATPENGTLSVKQGTTELSSGAQVDKDSEITITATPNTGYKIDTLTVNGAAFESGGTHIVIADVEIVAVFTEGTSINTNVVTTFILYPNPTNGKVNIEGLQQPANITVYNIAGVAMHTQQLNPAETLDLGHLPGGVYMIHVNNTTTLRVVKQ
ncbi:MAG: leucine-rich repeat protein [Salinivirgaceae bacterium]|jgi:hypothetical protein|nr:leucine-rich repeat protein [Bacteroidales bacterium]